jgi:hypothetical protein
MIGTVDNSPAYPMLQKADDPEYARRPPGRVRRWLRRWLRRLGR